jgi:hypothetical protein
MSLNDLHWLRHFDLDRLKKMHMIASDLAIRVEEIDNPSKILTAMVNSREALRNIVQELMNDVIEQGFHHLIHHPQESDELNRIIKDATDEMNYQLLKIDSHNHKPESEDLQKHYASISHDAQRKSLDLLSRLQRIQIQQNPRLRRV